MHSTHPSYFRIIKTDGSGFTLSTGIERDPSWVAEFDKHRICTCCVEELPPIIVLIPVVGPSLPPAIIKAWNTSSTSIQVSWQQVIFKARHGVLLEYHVQCVKHDSFARILKHVEAKIEQTAQLAVLSKLDKYTKYNCRVRAVNNFGNGTWSSFIPVQTSEDGESFEGVLEAILDSSKGP